MSVVSKAAERSKSVRREALPESSARKMSFIILRRAVSVLIQLLWAQTDFGFTVEQCPMSDENSAY